MTKLGDVPCGPCRACCRSEAIALFPEDGDDVASYEHELISFPGIGEVAVLKHKPNGDCIYLDRDGCSIHHRRPEICRVFDCRAFYLGMSRAERQTTRKHSPLTRATLNAGHERLKTLDPSELQKMVGR